MKYSPEDDFDSGAHLVTPDLELDLTAPSSALVGGYEIGGRRYGSD